MCMRIFNETIIPDFYRIASGREESNFSMCLCVCVCVCVCWGLDRQAAFDRRAPLFLTVSLYSDALYPNLVLEDNLKSNRFRAWKLIV